MVCYVPGSSLLDRLVKFFAFLSGKLYRRLTSAWRVFQSWAEVILDVLGVNSSTSGMFSGNRVVRSFCFLFGPVLGLERGCPILLVFKFLVIIFLWVLWFPRLGLSYHTRDFPRYLVSGGLSEHLLFSWEMNNTWFSWEFRFPCFFL